MNIQTFKPNLTWMPTVPIKQGTVLTPQISPNHPKCEITYEKKF